MKRKICMILALFALLVAVGCGGCEGCSGCESCTSCQGPPPEMHQVYDRFVELIEASKEINTVLYGAGLPVYAKDNPYAEYNHLYDGNDSSTYEMVTEYTKFFSEGQIKDAAEAVYTKECLAPFYTAAFDGLGFSSGVVGGVTEARYFEDTNNGWLYASSVAHDEENGLKGMRVYDYSTMEIINPSHAKRVLVRINTWMEKTPDQVEQTTLTFVPGEDGRWYLDTFTG